MDKKDLKASQRLQYILEGLSSVKDLKLLKEANSYLKNLNTLILN